MSKKRGLSLEEKRSRMMDFFFEKKDFFLLKELERQCPKEKGITSMSVKEVVTSLVDDGMVDTDKIGTSCYFWAFPSKASQNRKRKIADLTTNLEDLNNRKKSLIDGLKLSKVGKENTESRSETLNNLQTKQDHLKSLQRDLEQYRECDPDVIEQVKGQTDTAKDAANRWTDNVFSVKSWIKNKFCFDEKMIDKQFGIPEEFDYVD